MTEQGNRPEAEATPAAYDKPRVARLGDVKELTLGAGSRGRDQNGTKASRH